MMTKTPPGAQLGPLINGILRVGVAPRSPSRHKRRLRANVYRWLGALCFGGRAMAEWDWAKTIGSKLRQDLGEVHAVPREMLRLLARLGELTGDCEKSAASTPAEPRGDAAGGPAIPSRGIADKG